MAKTIKEKIAKIKELKRRVITVHTQRHKQIEKDLASTRDDIKKLEKETEVARRREREQRRKLIKKLEKEWRKKVEKAIKDCDISYVDIYFDEETETQRIEVGLTIVKKPKSEKKTPRGKK